MKSIIFSSDYDFQIIRIVNGDSLKAWDIANEMAENNAFEYMGVENYDVCEFPNLEELNNWIPAQIREGRMVLHPKK